MSGETWTELSDESDGWVNVIDGANGYVEPLYVVARYISGTSGVSWSEESDTSTTWTGV
jgi:hypothetical protein